jgi:hypothetical protein
VTARRRECLAVLSSTADAAGAPVHYSAVAAPLGISAWTAYDLLRELKAAGLASARYAHRPGVAVGRTQVGFSPTEAGRELLRAETATEDAAPLEERKLRRAMTLSASGMAALPRTADLAGHLGFWLAQALGLPGRTRAGLRQLLGTAPEAATALSTFVAAVYGGVAARSAEPAEELTAAVSAFQQRLGRTTAARRERLARSLATLLDSVPAAAPAAVPAPSGAAGG